MVIGIDGSEACEITDPTACVWTVVTFAEDVIAGTRSLAVIREANACLIRTDRLAAAMLFGHLAVAGRRAAQ